MKNVVAWRRGVVGGLLVGLLAWGLYAGFRPQPIAVDIATVSRGPLRVSVEQEGRTRVVHRYVITSPVVAYARRVRLDVGDAVGRGSSVVQLEPQRAEVLDVRRRREAEARIAATEDNIGAVEQREKAALAGADLAQKNFQRIRELRSKGHVTLESEDRARAEAERAVSELRSAQFSVATARHEFEAARTALRFANAGEMAAPINVRSPVAGKVLKIPHKSEGPVAAGEPLLEIGAADQLEVEVDLLSADAVRIRPGTRVVFDRWGGEKPLDGVVRLVEPIGFTKVSALGVEEQRVWVIVAFTSPREHWQQLGDGYRVEASFILWEGDNVLQIPASSLFRDGERWAAFAVENGKAVKRTVEVGQRSALAAQVKSGALEGEQVIAHPDDRLREGVRVAAR